MAWRPFNGAKAVKDGMLQSPFLKVRLNRVIVFDHRVGAGAVLGGQSRADQIEVSLNEDIKSKEERKMKQGPSRYKKTTVCAPRPHRQAKQPMFVTCRMAKIIFLVNKW